VIGSARKAPAVLYKTVVITVKRRHTAISRGRALSAQVMTRWPARLLAFAGLPVLALVAGCGGGASANNSTNSTFSVSPGTASIDTNCTGCNASSSGSADEQFTAMLNTGGAAAVTWSISPSSNAGSISSTGQYTPPPYLTADSLKVTVTAALTSSPSTTASATITVTPGFLQPLAPENAALGTNGTLTITGYIAEAGGSAGISYAVSNSATGSSGGQGMVSSSSNCTRNAKAFTYCTTTYTAPTTITSNTSTYVVATVGTSNSKTSTKVLLNTAGISSNPENHEEQQTTAIALGTSGSNNNDTQTLSGQTFCCGGTLGALIQNSSGTQYILSNNHVLARSDQAAAGETIVQPGLIEDNCIPYGTSGAKVAPVGVLTAFLPLSSSDINADAAIAQVNSNAVNSSGAIEELGLPQAGILAAAPPGTSCTIPSSVSGVSCTPGKGESPVIGMAVAKSGRTTGLTCANIAPIQGINAIAATVQVNYYKDCAETIPVPGASPKTYQNQIIITGNQFSDAGDSGSLVVDTANGEPVGLFFAGNVDPQTGNSIGVANPVSTVLSELGAQQGTTYTFVGTTDHPVSCLNYGAGSVNISSASTLTTAQTARAQHALTQARMIVNPTRGILGAATGQSNDQRGEPTVIVYVDQNSNVPVPQTMNGVRTEVIPATPQAVAAGTAPQSALAANAVPPLESAVLNQAISAKQQIEQNLMKQNPAFFGVGIGQSYDDPKEAALVIFVDRRQVPATLPAVINGLRTRYIIMDRLHVTRSYLAGPVRSQGHCMARSGAIDPAAFDPLQDHSLRGLNLH